MQFFDRFAPYVHWGLRLSLAATFIYHGWSKFPADAVAPQMGMAVPMVWAVACTEIASGLLLIAGGFGKDLLTRLGGIGVIVIMLGAICMVHLPNGWNVLTGGMEFQVLMLATGLYFLVKGNAA